ncbi:MAG: magnesium/cobalt transporter CorA [Vicinamibacterales bacterium]|nr:magnesium/cobalt transporter CorA [Vicinamibacterales bacterium]
MNDSADLPNSGPVIACAVYAGGVRVAEVGIDQIRDALAQPDQFVWLGLYEPDEALLRRVQKQLGLHDLAIEDAAAPHVRPKIEVYENSLFVVLRTAHLSERGHRLEFGETHAFVGHNYVVTVRHGSLQSHIGVRQRCEATPQLLAKGPGYVLHAVMDFVVDQYMPIVQQLEEDVQELEETILHRSKGTHATARIYRLRRDALQLRRAVSPLVDVCTRLMRFDVPFIREEARPYFQDVFDHVLRLDEAIDMQRELLTTSLEAHLALMSVEQNEHMKRITAWAAIIAVPTLIAGVYGMNFRNMPELFWKYGYHLSLLSMVLSSVGLYVGFRRSEWL